MSRTFFPSALPTVAGILLCLCAGLHSTAWAQNFPDPIRTSPEESETGDFRQIRRNGYGKRPPNPFRVTLSSYSSDSRTIERGVGTFGGLDVQYDAFTSRLLAGPTLIGFYADFGGGDQYQRSESAQFDIAIIGGGVMARRVFTESLDKRHFYIGAGAGYYTTRLNIDPLGPQRYKATSNSLGIRFQGGYQFTKNFYAQFDLLSLDLFRIRNADGRSLRVNPSGARLGIGYQF